MDETFSELFLSGVELAIWSVFQDAAPNVTEGSSLQLQQARFFGRPQNDPMAARQHEIMF
jgi:hypothetical protein